MLAALNGFYEEQVHGYDSAFVGEQVQAIASAIALKPGEVPEGTIGRALFGAGGLLEYCPNETAIFYRPDLVLRERRGNCLGLATVFLLVAERLGVHAYAVQQPPEHVVIGSKHGCWDPTRQFVPVVASAQATWVAWGKNGWFGVELPRDRLVCVHVATQGTVNLLVNRYDEADRLHRMALRIDGTEPASNQAMAYGAILRSDWNAARRHAQLAVESNPSETSRELLRAAREHEAPRRRSREIRYPPGR